MLLGTHKKIFRYCRKYRNKNVSFFCDSHHRHHEINRWNVKEKPGHFLIAPISSPHLSAACSAGGKVLKRLSPKDRLSHSEKCFWSSMKLIVLCYIGALTGRNQSKYRGFHSICMKTVSLSLSIRLVAWTQGVSIRKTKDNNNRRESSTMVNIQDPKRGSIEWIENWLGGLIKPPATNQFIRDRRQEHQLGHNRISFRSNNHQNERQADFPPLDMSNLRLENAVTFRPVAIRTNRLPSSSHIANIPVRPRDLVTKQPFNKKQIESLLMDSYLPRPVDEYDDEVFQILNTPQVFQQQNRPASAVPIAGSLMEELPQALLRGKIKFHAVAPNTLRVDFILHTKNHGNGNRRIWNWPKEKEKNNMTLVAFIRFLYSLWCFAGTRLEVNTLFSSSIFQSVFRTEIVSPTAPGRVPRPTFIWYARGGLGQLTMTRTDLATQSLCALAECAKQ